MSLPYSYIVPNSAVVESPAFSVEKKHMLLAIVNNLIPSGTPFIEFNSQGGLSEFGKYFGKGLPEYTAAQKYFGYVAKDGNTPQKLVVARWYKTAAGAFIKGVEVTETVTSLKAITSGSFNLDLDGTKADVVVNLGSITSYSDVADAIQTAMQTDWTGATCVYNSTTKGFIITSATTGATSVAGGIAAGSTGTDLSAKLGLSNAVVSQGADAESFAEFCDRIYQANSSGYSITTLEALTDDDVINSVKWLNGSEGEQTINSAVRLVFNYSDKATVKAMSASLDALGLTGYVLTYDPYSELVNILDCAICAAIDYDVENGAINFNFSNAAGYTPVTSLGTVVDYQQGMTNSALMTELNNAKISCVYSVGFGTQEQNYYGFGLMAGEYGTEDIQVNESALEMRLQVTIINALTTLNKIKLQGSDAAALVSALLASPLDLFKKNGSIALEGKLSTVDRVAVTQATGNPDAADAVEQNGYYFQVQPLSEEDIAARRVRVLICYLAAGVVNKVRIVNRIYSA